MGPGYMVGIPDHTLLPTLLRCALVKGVLRGDSVAAIRPKMFDLPDV
jgi:hypothetical protein